MEALVARTATAVAELLRHPAGLAARARARAGAKDAADCSLGYGRFSLRRLKHRSLIREHLSTAPYAF